MEPTDLRVVETIPLADNVVSFTLADPTGAALPRWQPGAHIEVELADGLLRHYSLCGPADDDTWRVAVLREPKSRGGSAYLHDTVKVGHQLRVRGLRNNFALAPANRYLFIAGGIGITPIIPMLDEATRAGANWRLVYGGRHRSTMAFVDELTGRYGDRVSVLPEDERGLLPLDELLGTPAPDTLVYCCGPEPLLTAVEQGCVGWPRGSLHIERFVAKELDVSSDQAFEVTLAGSGRVVTVAADQTLLAALADAGVEIDSACEEGICGTCETAVLAGTPDHRDSVLTDEEREAGKLIFPCISRAAGPGLVLDL